VSLHAFSHNTRTHVKIHTYTQVADVCRGVGGVSNVASLGLRVGEECIMVPCMDASCHIYESVSELLGRCIKEPPLSHKGKTIVSLSFPHKKKACE